MERAMLAETVALIRTAPGMEDSMTHLTRRVASLAARFLLGGSTAEAEADLANRVTAMAERGHLTVDRVVPVADSLRRAGGAVQRVVVQASLTGDLPELLRLLDSLGRGATLLTPASIRLSAGDPSAPVASPEAIKADLTITGWFFVGDTAR
jgi:hypothetical protein